MATALDLFRPHLFVAISDFLNFIFDIISALGQFMSL